MNLLMKKNKFVEGNASGKVFRARKCVESKLPV